MSQFNCNQPQSNIYPSRSSCAKDNVETDLYDVQECKKSEETLYWSENVINIILHDIENIDPNKFKNVSFRIEFKGEVIVESDLYPVPENGEFKVDFKSFIPVTEPSAQIIDDIVGNPILIYLLDRTVMSRMDLEFKKDSKKESKKDSKVLPSRAASAKSANKMQNVIATPNVIGVCSMDIGALITGTINIKQTLIMEVDKNYIGASVVPWPKLPRLTVTASSGVMELIPERRNKQNNLLSITVESIYNVPGNIDDGTLFDATILIPKYSDKLEPLVYPNGNITHVRDGECLKRWLTLPHIEGRANFTKHTISTSVCDIINPDNECGDIGKSVLEDGPRIQWNKWRSNVMVKTGTNYFFKTISNKRVWPIEVSISNRTVAPRTAKNDKRAKTATVASSSGSEKFVAYLKLGSLLYPGTTKVRVASRLYTYSAADVIAKCGPDFVPRSQSQSHNVQPARAKPDEKSKTAAKEVRDMKEAKESQELKEVEPTPLFNENGLPVFIVVEIEVWKPYLPKKEPEIFFNRFESYLPPRAKVSSQLMNVKFAQENFNTTIEKLSHFINENYKDYLAEEHQSGIEPTRENFFRYLCDSENYRKIGTSLEEKIVDLIGEKYGTLGERKEKIPEIFIDLVGEMRKITSSLISYNKYPNKRYDVQANSLQLSAEEAIEEGNYPLAKRYLLQKINLNKLNADYWLDYALFLIVTEEYEKSVEAIREALMLDINHQMALLMYALIMSKMSKLDLAELTFDVLLAKYPDFIEGWYIFHLYHLSIGNTEKAEYFLQWACRLECEERSKENVCVEKNFTEMDSMWSNSDVSNEENFKCYNVLSEGRYGFAAFVNGKIVSDPLSWTAKMDREYSLNQKAAILLLRLRFYELAELALIQEPVADKKDMSLQYMYYVAVNHYLRKQYGEAVLHLQEAVEKYGQNCALWGLLGHCYYKLEQYENCILCFKYVIDSNNRPDDIHLIFIRMGIYYMRTRKYKCAKKMYLSACKYSPSAQTWLGLGAACYNLGEYIEAETALVESNYLDYLCPVVWAYLTLTNIQLERYDLVQLCYAEVVKKNLKDERLMNQIKTLMEVHRLNVSQ